MDNFKHVWDYCIQLKDHCHIHTKESKCGNASNSEVRRWIEQGAVIINGKRWKPLDVVPPVHSVVLFPNGKNRTTIL